VLTAAAGVGRQKQETAARAPGRGGVRHGPPRNSFCPGLPEVRAGLTLSSSIAAKLGPAVFLCSHESGPAWAKVEFAWTEGLVKRQGRGRRRIPPPAVATDPAGAQIRARGRAEDGYPFRGPPAAPGTARWPARSARGPGPAPSAGPDPGPRRPYGRLGRVVSGSQKRQDKKPSQKGTWEDVMNAKVCVGQ